MTKFEIEKELMPLNDITRAYIGEKNNKNVVKIGVKKMSSDITRPIPKEKEGHTIVVEETGELTAY